MTTGKATYAQLTDVILSDISDSRLKKRTPEQWMDAILRAEESICSLTTVREEMTLRYLSGITDYALQNRPAITAATNTSPITVTSTAHGLSNHKRVFITGGQGDTAVNGTWFTSGVATNTFIINPGAYISNIEEDDAGLLITTETDHGFTDGATITHANITAPTAANGDHVITLVSDTSYTIAVSPVDPTFTNDDVAVAYWLLQSTGNGTYTGGGRVRLDTELPVYVSKVLGGSVIRGGIRRDTFGDHIDDLNRFRSSRMRTNSFPFNTAIVTVSGQKYLRIDPIPSADGDVTLQCEFQIVPEECYGETPDLTIHLSNEYNPLIRAYMKGRAYEWLDNTKMMDYWDAKYMNEVGIRNLNEPDHMVAYDSD